ncbi:MAG: hypothetical protein J7524_22590 [Roseofilum sp. Belize BBD 4]|uniref:hypothetical protein n=1 Tax=Roseofilum sp. Belize BBD 4 TaxID=2821500 RepID=UPI001B2F19CC|nr:hypothetical protein [Roseofilum sp. Belize BBD 4]MBP0035912.1 hypothetical protein [Roseofilum sp. Belize BBD 4]
MLLIKSESVELTLTHFRSPMTEDNTIRIRGAREHNLKNIDLECDRLIVFSGVLGLGKSSLLL